MRRPTARCMRCGPGARTAAERPVSRPAARACPARTASTLGGDVAQLDVAVLRGRPAALSNAASASQRFWPMTTPMAWSIVVRDTRACLQLVGQLARRGQPPSQGQRPGRLGPERLGAADLPAAERVRAPGVQVERTRRVTAGRAAAPRATSARRERLRRRSTSAQRRSRSVSSSRTSSPWRRRVQARRRRHGRTAPRSSRVAGLVAEGHRHRAAWRLEGDAATEVQPDRVCGQADAVVEQLLGLLDGHPDLGQRASDRLGPGWLVRRGSRHRVAHRLPPAGTSIVPSPLPEDETE